MPFTDPSAEFTQSVIARYSGRCGMQIWIGVGLGTLRRIHDGWLAHGRLGTVSDPVSVVRIYAAGDGSDIWNDPVLGVAACQRCANRFGGTVSDKLSCRVPPDREAAAYEFLVVAHAHGELSAIPLRRETPIRPTTDLNFSRIGDLMRRAYETKDI